MVIHEGIQSALKAAIQNVLGIIPTVVTTMVMRYDLTSSFLIFYVGNSSTASCVSISLSVIVECVMMRWKMNDHFTRTPCKNTMSFI